MVSWQPPQLGRRLHCIVYRRGRESSSKSGMEEAAYVAVPGLCCTYREERRLPEHGVRQLQNWVLLDLSTATQHALLSSWYPGKGGARDVHFAAAAQFGI